MMTNNGQISIRKAHWAFGSGELKVGNQKHTIKINTGWYFNGVSVWIKSKAEQHRTVTRIKASPDFEHPYEKSKLQVDATLQS